MLPSLTYADSNVQISEAFIASCNLGVWNESHRLLIFQGCCCTQYRLRWEFPFKLGQKGWCSYCRWFHANKQSQIDVGVPDLSHFPGPPVFGLKTYPTHPLKCWTPGYHGSLTHPFWGFHRLSIDYPHTKHRSFILSTSIIIDDQFLSHYSPLSITINHQLSIY